MYLIITTILAGIALFMAMLGLILIFLSWVKTGNFDAEENYGWEIALCALLLALAIQVADLFNIIFEKFF